ncbi:hypothetical protein [Streptomyces sp. NPDC058045]
MTDTRIDLDARRVEIVRTYFKMVDDGDPGQWGTTADGTGVEEHPCQIVR